MTDETLAANPADDAARPQDANPAVLAQPAPKADGKPGTVLTDTTDKPVAAPADWPEDWRAKLAGGDDKAMKTLDRFRSPQDLAKAYREAQVKLSQIRPEAPGKDATEEQVAAYRKAAGVPDAPDGYLEKLPKGLVIGDDDKPAVTSFLSAMHARNVDPATVGEALNWYYTQQEAATAAQTEADRAAQRTAEDALRQEWGTEYRSNVNAITSFLDGAPKSEDGAPLKDLIMGARLADGTPLGSHPAALRWLAQLANDANPGGFIAPSSGATQIQSVDDEIGKIEKTMRTDRQTYDRDAQMQTRYLKLLEARERLKARS